VWNLPEKTLATQDGSLLSVQSVAWWGHVVNVFVLYFTWQFSSCVTHLPPLQPFSFLHDIQTGTPTIHRTTNLRTTNLRTTNLRTTNLRTTNRLWLYYRQFKKYIRRDIRKSKLYSFYPEISEEYQKRDVELDSSIFYVKFLGGLAYSSYLIYIIKDGHQFMILCDVWYNAVANVNF
jgi:hypothetical protein